MSMFRNIIIGKSSRLPAEYQEVEYIEGTGTQYIKTNIIGKPTMEYELDFALTTAARSFQMYLASERSPHSCPKVFMDSGTFSNIRVQGNGTVYIYDITPYAKNKLLYSSGVIYFNDVSVGGMYSLGTTNTKEFWIFNAVEEPTLIASMRLYELIFWDNSVEVNHLVPCYRKSDNEIGLYDIIENVFYTNQGTGTFIKGGNV